MDLHIKHMIKEEYIVPALQIVDINSEGLICSSVFKGNMMFIDDVDEGVDYGIL